MRREGAPRAVQLVSARRAQTAVEQEQHKSSKGRTQNDAQEDENRVPRRVVASPALGRGIRRCFRVVDACAIVAWGTQTAEDAFEPDAAATTTEVSVPEETEASSPARVTVSTSLPPPSSVVPLIVTTVPSIPELGETSSISPTAFSVHASERLT